MTEYNPSVLPPHTNRLQPLEIVSIGGGFYTVKFKNIDNNLVRVPRKMLYGLLAKEDLEALLIDFEHRTDLEEAIRRSLVEAESEKQLSVGDHLNSDDPVPSTSQDTPSDRRRNGPRACKSTPQNDGKR